MPRTITSPFVLVSRGRRAIRGAMATALIVVGLLIPTPAATSVPVTDIAHTVETILAAIRRYEQIARSIQHQVRNLENLDEWSVREVYGVLAGFAQFLAYAESLVYTDIDRLEGRWFETFQAFERIDVALYPRGAADLDEQRQRRVLETMWGIMRGVRLQANNVSSGQVMLDRIKDQGAAAVGNLDAAQAQILIQAYEAEELAQIRQLLAAQTNVQLVAVAAEQSREAQRTAEVNEWLGLDDDPPPVGDFASSPIRNARSLLR